ncbi:MAG: T9SS type A sorting domain-containing protein [Bacteroidales bacterium]|nr:T9SS type A sorting domain-containing protein [Bacteroidales bacterium]
MKKIFITFIVLIFYICSFSQDGGWRKNESEVKVYISNISQVKNLKSLLLNGDVYNDYAIVYAIPDELNKIKQLGLKYEILKNNLNEYFSGFWNTDVPPGYYDYQDIIDIADSLTTNFPDICQKIIFGTSMGGRQLAALKISDNVATDENEAEVLFDGGIHGDELCASENVIRFARDLCKGYEAGDPQITELINTREIWLYLMVNPDGRVNMTRHNNNGVDLNRDWGYMWDGWGSSTSEYSQIESKMLRSCTFDNQFVVHTTYHSGTEYISLPWSYRSSQCPDFGHIYQLAGVYVSESGYTTLDYGQGNTGMYAINGSTKDSNYGIQGSISWSMEISYDKQPPASQVQYYYNINKPSMLAMIEYSGYGLEGTLTDAITGEPVQGIIFVNDYFQSYSDPVVGDYHKYVLPGNYSVTVTANGYETQTIDNVVVTEENSTVTDFQMQALDEQYAYKIWSCRIPDNNEYDEGNTLAVFGAPDNVNYSIGKNGTIVLDMQNIIYDGLGNDVKIFEGDASPETYDCFAGGTADGPWVFIGTGTGTTEFDFAGMISEAQFIRIEDDGDGLQNEDNAGFDLDAVEALEHVSGVYLSVTDYYIDDSSTGNNDGILDPGETADIIITIRNNGDITANNTIGDIVSSDPYLTLITTSDNFGNIAQHETAQGTFTVHAIPETPQGYEATMNLNLSANSGTYVNSEEINLIIGFVPEYCEAGSNDDTDEFIERVQFVDIDNTTTIGGGYNDYTHISTDVETEGSYPITITNGDHYSSDQMGCWVDWNYDGDFEDADESFTIAYSSSIGTGTVTVPADARIGSTTMRLRVMYTGTLSPCGNASYGEVEDYTLNVLPNGVYGGTANANPTVICVSGTTTLTLSGWVGDDMQWQSSPDGSTWSDISGAVSTPYTTAIFTSDTYFRAEVTMAGYDPAYSNTALVYVNDAPVAGTAAVDVNEICEGETVILSLTGQSGDIQWQESPDGTSWVNISGAVGTPYTTSALDADTYFRAEVSNPGCDPAYSNDELVTVYDAPVGGTASADETSICTGSSTTITLTGYTGDIQWQNSPDGSVWTDISGATSAVYITDNLIVTTHFRAVLSSYLCDDTNSSTVEITVVENPVAGYSFTANNQELTFANESTNATSYSWNFGDGNSSTDVNPVHTYTSSDTYTVTLTAINGVCADDVHSKDIAVTFVGISQIESNVSIVPNPNNGIFKINLCNLNISETTVCIYSISGQIIYQSNAYSKMLEIDLTNYNKGVYFVRITSGNEAFNRKIVLM